MAEEQKTIAIYGLTCPTTGKIRYVGRSQDPESRLESHLRAAQSNYHRNRRLYKWLRELLEQELRPGLVTIEEVTEDTWADREWHWITYYGLENLFNTLIRNPQLPSRTSFGRARMKRVNFHLPAHQFAEIKEISSRTGLPMAEIFRQFVDDGLEKAESGLGKAGFSIDEEKE